MFMDCINNWRYIRMKSLFQLCLLWAAGLTLTSCQLPAQPDEKDRIILTNCNIIDCAGNGLQENMTLVIQDNRILQIHRGRHSEKADRVLDLKGAYVLPGLWNMHVHLSDLWPDVKNMLKEEELASASIRAGRNAMDALKWGFTGLRMVGERDYLDIAWRDAFNAGVFVGPRIYAAGKIVNPNNVEDEYWPVAIPTDGPDEYRRAHEENIAKGLDFYKITAPVTTAEQFKVAIDLAHEAGLKITAHASGQNAHNAVVAGIDCIEHGTMMRDETIELMAEQGTFYCPTVVCNLSEQYLEEREERLAKLGYSEDAEAVKGRILVAQNDQRSQEVAARHREIIVTAAAKGVKIIPGADSNPLDELGILEIEQLYLSGLTEMQVLEAATRNCAEMCGVLDELGTLEEGKLADIIVVAENPLENISNLRKLQMVIKDGKPVNLSRDEGQASFWKLYFQE